MYTIFLASLFDRTPPSPFPGKPQRFLSQSDLLGLGAPSLF